MRQPEAAMRLMILLERPLSRGHRGQMACASPPMFFKNILMTLWHTTLSHIQHCLSREAIDDYLRQRRSSGSCRTPHTLNSMVKSSVDIFTKKVDCCHAGCVAFSAHRKDLHACDVCHAPRYCVDGKSRMQATYWPLLPWIRMMLADPDIGAGMVKTMEQAREAAAGGPPKDLRDFFDGPIFRKLMAQGCFSSNTCVAISDSTDGLQAWKQRGLEGWPIAATILHVDPSGRVQVVSQLIVGITPGPSQPADLDSFFHPIAEDLNAFAAGVSGIAVAGYDEPQLVPGVVRIWFLGRNTIRIHADPSYLITDNSLS